MTTSETTVHSIEVQGVIESPGKKNPLKIIQWVRNNPILSKEMRSRMRGLRSLVALTFYIGLLGLSITLIYSSLISITQALQIDTLQTIGRSIFVTIFVIELLVVCMTSPAL